MKKLVVFFGVFLLVFLIIPILGVYTQHQIFSKNIFNYSYSLYLLDISSDKNRTMLGKDDWMFLGNNYRTVIERSNKNYKESSGHIKRNEAFMAQLDTIATEANADFVFFSAPNKHSIYGEYIGLDTDIDSYSYYKKNTDFIRSDVVSYFRKIKATVPYHLYFKTDTHWNDFGAFYGYQYLMKYSLNGLYQSLPTSLAFHKVNVQGGDLARFLNVSDFITDVNVAVDEPLLGKVIRTNLTTNDISEVGIQGDIHNAAIKKPINIKNKKALNKLKVLWLHDSFGRAMSPYMHMTFTDVTHQHFHHAFKSMEAFKELVTNVKPELIILSSVERVALDFGDYLNN